MQQGFKNRCLRHDHAFKFPDYLPFCAGRWKGNQRNGKRALCSTVVHTSLWCECDVGVLFSLALPEYALSWIFQDLKYILVSIETGSTNCKQKQYRKCATIFLLFFSDIRINSMGKYKVRFSEIEREKVSHLDRVAAKKYCWRQEAPSAPQQIEYSSLRNGRRRFKASHPSWRGWNWISVVQF